MNNWMCTTDYILSTLTRSVTGTPTFPLCFEPIAKYYQEKKMIAPPNPTDTNFKTTSDCIR